MSNQLIVTKKIFLAVILSLVATVFSNEAYSVSAGISGYSGNPLSANGGVYCNLCHNTGIVPTIKITGNTSVTANSTVNYTVSISGGQQQIGGINISASAGTLSIIPGDSNLAKVNQELTHSKIAVTSGQLNWDFKWQAPSMPGSYTLYAAGVSANNDQLQSGDAAGTDTLVISVLASEATPIAVIISPLTGLLNSSITFGGGTSTAASGASIVQYDWTVDKIDFFNSGSSTVSTFTTEGRHTVTLTVTDSNTITATTFTDIIIGTTVIPDVNHNGPFAAETGVAINFDVSTSTTDSSTSVINYIWDYGDGSTISQGASPTTSHTYTTAGRYTVTIAAQDGNTMTGVGHSLATITTPTQPATGQEIYETKCLSCHGPGGGGGSDKNIVGATQAIILDALANVNQMIGIPLTSDEAQLLENYLAVTGTTGEQLYIGLCQICHGVAGVGDSAPAVIGATRVMILDKITSVPSMNSIAVNNAQSQLIADFLGTATASTGSEFYAIKCAICHGATGAGIVGVGPAVKGATQFMITDAINNVTIMDGIVLSNNKTQLVSDFLGAGGNTGQQAYINKCALCHGAAGIGRNGYGPAVKGATENMIRGEINNVSEMTGINLEGKSQIIADYLGSGGSTGQDYYSNKCFICHGANGTGSSGPYDGGDIQGKSGSKYQDAINKKQEMNGILLTDTEAQSIENYLKSGGG